MWVAGADACKAGWFVVLRQLPSGVLRSRSVVSFGHLVRLPEKPRVLAVDIPIGLLDRAEPGGRQCDREARELLGWPRRNSVFSPPVHSALDCVGYSAALRENRRSSELRVGISKQTFGLFEKLREARSNMTPLLQTRIYEIHPELSFFLMARRPLEHSKKEIAGQRERKAMLRGFSPVVRRFEVGRWPGVGWDDCLDACAACWTAARIARGVALRFPRRRVRDSRGLRMEIWR